MIDDWWQAHRLEVVVWAVIVGLTAILWLLIQIAEIRAERRKRREDGLL